jgi:O-antigen/teichoic acid export membrane protein
MTRWMKTQRQHLTSPDHSRTDSVLRQPTIASNISWNVMGLAVNILAGMATMPILLYRLGTEKYGLWCLATAFIGYLSLLDIGTGAAVGRRIAPLKAANAIDGINAALSTALLPLVSAAAATLLVAPFVATLFLLTFPSAGHELELGWALPLLALNVAITFPGSIFGGLLWGYERFDILNWIDIPAALMRVVFILAATSFTTSIVALAAIMVGINFCVIAARAIACCIVEPRLRLKYRYVSLPIARSMISFGSAYLTISLAQTFIPRIATTIIGYRLGPSSVATYAVAQQLATTISSLARSATQITAPREFILSAAGRKQEQLQLFMDGSRLSLAVVALCITGVAAFGYPLIQLWPNAFAQSVLILFIILMIGDAVPNTQLVSYSAIMGMGQHRVLAVLAIAETLTVMVLSYALSALGLIGVCIAVALSATAFRGWLRWLIACRLHGIKPGIYVQQVIAPAIAGLAFPIGLVLLITSVFPPLSWLALGLVGAACTVVLTCGLAVQIWGWPQGWVLHETLAMAVRRSKQLCNCKINNGDKPK